MRSSACCRTPVSSLRAATITDRRVEGNLPSVPPFQSDITRIICPTNLRALRPLWRECVPPAHFSLFLRHLVAKKIHVRAQDWNSLPAPIRNLYSDSGSDFKYSTTSSFSCSV